MNGAPHPMLEPLWREAGAASAMMRALRSAEPALDALAADPFAALVDTASIDWAAEEQDGDDAIQRALAKLRTAETPVRPSAPRTATADAPTEEPGQNATVVPEDGPPTDQAEPALPPPASEREAVASQSSSLTWPLLNVAPEWAGALVHAAQQPVSFGTVKPAISRAVGLILDGRHPPTGTLLEAIGLPSDRDEPVAPMAAERGNAAVAAALARVDAARRVAASTLASATSRTEPMAADTLTMSPMGSTADEVFAASPVAPPMPPIPASGFRRLAAMFATPDGSRTGRIGEARDAGPAPASPFNAPAPAAEHRPVGIVEHARFDATREVIPRALRAINDDAAGDAEMAERLARILRREARRQGIADEGGAA